MRSPLSEGPFLSPSVYSEQPDQGENQSRRHRPFSGFFNGRSALSSRGYNAQLSNASNASTPSMPRFFMPHVDDESQSASSPRSLLSMRVGPTAPPSMGSRTHSMASFNGGGIRGLALPARAQVLDYGGNVPFVPGAEAPREESQAIKTTSQRRRRRHHGPRWTPKHAEGKIWFPSMASVEARKKLFHAVVSGTLLAIILIVCMLS